jgi:chromosome segregation ATPase
MVAIEEFTPKRTGTQQKAKVEFHEILMGSYKRNLNTPPKQLINTRMQSESKINSDREQRLSTIESYITTVKRLQEDHYVLQKKNVQLESKLRCSEDEKGLLQNHLVEATTAGKRRNALLGEFITTLKGVRKEVTTIQETKLEAEINHQLKVKRLQQNLKELESQLEVTKNEKQQISHQLSELQQLVPTKEEEKICGICYNDPFTKFSASCTHDPYCLHVMFIKSYSYIFIVLTNVLDR